jgi:GTP-binding protein Era
LADRETAPSGAHRFGKVAVCGRPNVGKSTLINALLGETISIVTARPQTTRERVLGIWSTDQFQAVLTDTPGIHEPRSALNRFMVDEAFRSAKNVDLVFLLDEAPALTGAEALRKWEPGPMVRETHAKLVKFGVPIVLILTKIDRLKAKDHLLQIIRRWQTEGDFADIVPISSTQGDGLERLAPILAERLPEGPPQFSRDDLSDRQMRWHAAELIRGELFACLGQELPYSCAVTVTEYKEGAGEDVVRATVFVERESQKGMVVGRGGARIREVSMAAREKIAALSGHRCHLFLTVQVAKNWTKDPDKLADFGYVARDKGSS